MVNNKQNTCNKQEYYKNLTNARKQGNAIAEINVLSRIPIHDNEMVPELVPSFTVVPNLGSTPKNYKHPKL